MIMKNSVETVEIRPGVFENMSQELVDRCNGDVETAAFFHSIGTVLMGDDVCNDTLKSGNFLDN